MKKEIKLTRIHCVGCATNLEQKIAEVEGVKSVSIDFVNKVVTIDASPNNIKQVKKRVEEVIVNFDSSIKIVDQSDIEKQNKKEKIMKIIDVSRIALCVLLLLFANLLPNMPQWLSKTFFVAAYVLIGYEIIISAFINLFKGKMLDENFLMLVATVGAFALKEFNEAVAVMLLYTIGEFFEKLAVEKSRNRVKSLLKIKSQTANIIISGDELIVPVENLKKGDIIRIKPYEKVPVDCVVIEGSSSLNTAAITGESKEFYAEAKSDLLSGFINGEGVLLCKVEKPDSESTVSKIIELVESATKSKAKTERFITKFAKWYTPIVVIVAILLAGVPCIFGQQFSTWLYRALVFLVVSCPCALVISVPLSYFAGIGSAARKGVLVKGANHIETLAKVNSIIFDKTGTLTYGNFEVQDIYAVESSSEQEVLELIAYGESFSNHSIAKSIVKKYGKTINTAFVEEYKEIAGLGVEATLFNERCLIGNAKLLKSNNIEIDEPEEVGTIVYLAKNNEFIGYIVVADQIKDDSFDAIQKLRELGIKNMAMFTGDNQAVAKNVSNKLKLDNYYAGLLPSGKVEALQKYKEQGYVSAFVGDGINDAPILATVDVGVSMGGMASDAAVEASDVVLMTNEPSKLVDAIKISKKTRKIVLENIIFTLLIKLAVLLLSAIGYTGMWVAIFADVGVALLAVLNALRILLPVKSKKTKCNVKKQ